MTSMYTIKSALADALCVKEDNTILEQLFSRYVTPQELLNASAEELVSIKGLSVKKLNRSSERLSWLGRSMLPKLRVIGLVALMIVSSYYDMKSAIFSTRRVGFSA